MLPSLNRSKNDLFPILVLLFVTYLTLCSSPSYANPPEWSNGNQCHKHKSDHHHKAKCADTDNESDDTNAQIDSDDESDDRADSKRLPSNDYSQRKDAPYNKRVDRDRYDRRKDKDGYRTTIYDDDESNADSHSTTQIESDDSRVEVGRPISRDPTTVDTKGRDRESNRDYEDERYSMTEDEEKDSKTTGVQTYETVWVDRGHRSDYVASGQCHYSKVHRVAGTLVGGLIGSQFGKGNGKKAATVLGAFIGYQVGKKMDKADQYCTSQALEYTPSHRRTVWHNPNSNVHYVVYPTRTYRSNGRYCRQYVTVIDRGGNRHREYRRACRYGAGRWREVY